MCVSYVYLQVLNVGGGEPLLRRDSHDLLPERRVFEVSLFLFLLFLFILLLFFILLPLFLALLRVLLILVLLVLRQRLPPRRVNLPRMMCSLEDRNMIREMATWGPQRSTDECSLTSASRGVSTST